MYAFLVIASVAFAKGQNIEERKISAFDKLFVSNEMKVYLIKGNEEKLKIAATGIDMSDIHSKINGKTLELEFSRGLFKEANVEVYITYHELREINASSSSKISVQDTIQGDKIIISASSGSEVCVGVHLKTADLKVSQGATIRLSGKISSYEAKVSTGGILAASDLKADSTFLNVNSAGIAKIFSTQLIDASVRTGSTLTITGNPKNKVISKGLGVTINEL